MLGSLTMALFGLELNLNLMLQERHYLGILYEFGPRVIVMEIK